MTDSIHFKMTGVSGDLPLSEAKMHCIKSQKYTQVKLGFSRNGKTMIIPFAQIKLHDADLYIDAKEVFEDACMLGDAIVEAWEVKRAKNAEAKP